MNTNSIPPSLRQTFQSQLDMLNKVGLKIGKRRQSLEEWSEERGVPIDVIRERVATGWTPRDAVSLSEGSKRPLNTKRPRKR